MHHTCYVYTLSYSAGRQKQVTRWWVEWATALISGRTRRQTVKDYGKMIHTNEGDKERVRGRERTGEAMWGEHVPSESAGAETHLQPPLRAPLIKISGTYQHGLVTCRARTHHPSLHFTTSQVGSWCIQCLACFGFCTWSKETVNVGRKLECDLK